MERNANRVPKVLEQKFKQMYESADEVLNRIGIEKNEHYSFVSHFKTREAAIPTTYLVPERKPSMYLFLKKTEGTTFRDPAIDMQILFKRNPKNDDTTRLFHVRLFKSTNDYNGIIEVGNYPLDENTYTIPMFEQDTIVPIQQLNYAISVVSRFTPPTP